MHKGEILSDLAAAIKRATLFVRRTGGPFRYRLMLRTVQLREARNRRVRLYLGYLAR